MKRILTVLLAAILALTPFSLTACNRDTNKEEPPKTISLLGNVDLTDEWIDYNAADLTGTNKERGYDSFELSTGKNALYPLKSKKYHEYDYIYKTVGQYDLSEYKKLRVEAHIAAGDEPATCTISIDSFPRIPAGFNEITFPVTSIDPNEPDIFEFDFSFDKYAEVRTGISIVRLFAHPGVIGADDADYDEENPRPAASLPGSGLSDIYFDKLEFSSDTPVGLYVLNEEAEQVEKPNNFDINNPEDPFNINQNFALNPGEGGFDVQWIDGVTYIIALDAKQPWTYVNSPVMGNLQGHTFNALRIKYKGTNGTSFKVKLEISTDNPNNYETTRPGENEGCGVLDPTCSGVIEEFTWKNIPKTAFTSGAQMMVLIFFQPNISGGACAGNMLEIYEFELFTYIEPAQ